MLTIKEVQHIARLARIKLSEKELEKFQKELSSILDYINKLSEINTKDVEPTSQVTGLTDIIREDKIDECEKEERELIMKNMPQKSGELLKVKAVF